MPGWQNMNADCVIKGPTILTWQYAQKVHLLDNKILTLILCFPLLYNIWFN